MNSPCTINYCKIQFLLVICHHNRRHAFKVLHRLFQKINKKTFRTVVFNLGSLTNLCPDWPYLAQFVRYYFLRIEAHSWVATSSIKHWALAWYLIYENFQIKSAKFWIILLICNGCLSVTNPPDMQFHQDRK